MPAHATSNQTRSGVPGDACVVGDDYVARDDRVRMITVNMIMDKGAARNQLALSLCLFLFCLTGCSVLGRPTSQHHIASTALSGHSIDTAQAAHNSSGSPLPGNSDPGNSDPGRLAGFLRGFENVTMRHRADWRDWARQHLQTGDLVFTRGNHYVLLGLVNFTDLATRACEAEFSHVGIVAVKDEVPYVYDVSEQGVTRKPFAQYITQPGYERVTIRRLQPAHWHLLPDVLGYIERQRHAEVPFDHQFAEGPEALYCTELICLAFTEAGTPICPTTKVAELPNWNDLPGWLAEAGQWATGLTPQSRLYPIGNEDYGLIGSPMLKTQLPPTEIAEGPPRELTAETSQTRAGGPSR